MYVQKLCFASHRNHSQFAFWYSTDFFPSLYFITEKNTQTHKHTKFAWNGLYRMITVVWIPHDNFRLVCAFQSMNTITLQKQNSSKLKKQMNRKIVLVESKHFYKAKRIRLCIEISMEFKQLCIHCSFWAYSAAQHSSALSSEKFSYSLFRRVLPQIHQQSKWILIDKLFSFGLQQLQFTSMHAWNIQ